MKVKKIDNNMLEQNSYVIKKKSDAIVIDPGFNGNDLVQYLKEQNITNLLVILTHAHFDHIKGIETLAKEFEFDLLVSEFDKALLLDDSLNYAKSFNSKFSLPKLNIIEVSELSKYNFLDQEIKFIDTPGHTKGSICIKIKNHLFSGDTLFYNSIGRTDLYSGNQTSLFKSLKELTAKISNDTLIHPGHGPSGELKEIKEINPYL